jgi:hypothetical protein
MKATRDTVGTMNSYKILVGKLDEETPVATPRLIWEDNGMIFLEQRM